jgi:hypothetical protein
MSGMAAEANLVFAVNVHSKVPVAKHAAVSPTKKKLS